MIAKRTFVTLMVAVSASPMLGCNDAPNLPPIQVETDQFAYAADEAYEVCPGTVVYAEGWMEALAERLGIAATDILPTTYYFVHDEVLAHECGGDPDHPVHCTRHKGDRIEVFSSFVLFRHELVHALHLSAWPKRQPILHEGLASAFDDGSAFPAFSVPTSDELDAAIEAESARGHNEVTAFGGYLVYWIVQRHGEEALSRFWEATTRPMTAVDFRAAFELEFGESLDAMLAEVDAMSCQLVTCFGEPRAWIDGRWTTSSPQGCEDDSVVGVLGPDRYAAIRYDLVEIAQAGSYDVVVAGEQPGEFAMVITPCDAPCPESLSIDVGETQTLQLAAGRYRVTMAQIEPDEPTKTVEISPSI